MNVELHAHSVRLIVISLILLIPAVIFAFRKNGNALFLGFWRMLAGWSLIDIVIGVGSLLGKGETNLPKLLGFLKFNTELDGLYILIGLLMAWRSLKPTVKGMGWGIVVQGGVLLLLDLFLLSQLQH